MNKKKLKINLNFRFIYAKTDPNIKKIYNTLPNYLLTNY